MAACNVCHTPGMDRAVREAEEIAWVDQFRPLIDLMIAAFLESGEWPAVDGLQRDVDRLIRGMLVNDALNAMPRLSGEMRAYSWTDAVLPLRFFKHLDQGRKILPACLSVIQRSIEIWYSDADPPVLRSDDPYLLGVMPGRPHLIWERAGKLVNQSQPSVLGGGSWRPDFWELNVNGGVVRQLPDIETIDDYFDAQANIMDAAQTLRDAAMDPLPSGPTQHSVFILMPFEKTWSAAALELFHLAADQIEVEPKPHLYRADEIEESDWITDQIMDAIRTADAVVADITELNPNVMWELGYAQALDKPVVMVNQRSARDSPFDVRGWRQVQYGLPPTDKQVERLTRFMSVALAIS